MSRADREAARADRVRTRYSNRSLATGRRGRTDPGLAAEQEAYRRQFPSRPSPKQMPVISDVNGNYPDQLWDRENNRFISPSDQ